MDASRSVAEFIRVAHIALSLVVILLMAGTADAHAELVTANPAPGQVVDGSPAMVWLQFSEPLRPGSEIVLFGTGFRAVSGVQVALDLTQPTRLVAILPELAPDNYTVQWKSVSIDGDILSGSFSFGVRARTVRFPWPFGLFAAALVLAALVALWLGRRRSQA